MWAWDVESKEGYVCIEVEYLEPSELYTSFSYAPKTTLRDSYFRK